MSTLQYAPTLKRNACPTCLAVFRRSFARCPLDGAELEVVDRDPLIGHRLAEDRYEIEACIGEGGMGQVYRAKHTRMSRRFAVKVLYGDLAADKTMRARFSREAEAASRLTHPNLVSVVDFGETPKGLLYLVMEYVDGILLAELSRRCGALETDRAMELFRQMASGLEHAHSKGLVHRDFKPDNVMVASTPDGEIAKILDFGIARLQEDQAGDGKPLTTVGTLMGTPAFMSPEQAAGGDVDERTDLFSLGVTLYQLATGRLPFDGDSMGVLRQNMALIPPSMSQRVPGLVVDPRLEAIAMKLMAKLPDNRYQTARDVILEVDEWWVPPRARRASTPLGMPRFVRPTPSQPALQVQDFHIDDFEHAPTWDVAQVGQAGQSGHLTTLIEQGAAVEPTPVRVYRKRTGRRRRLALAGVLVAGIGAIALAWGIFFPLDSDRASSRAAGSNPRALEVAGNPAEKQLASARNLAEKQLGPADTQPADIEPVTGGVGPSTEGDTSPVTGVPVATELSTGNLPVEVKDQGTRTGELEPPRSRRNSRRDRTPRSEDGARPGHTVGSDDEPAPTTEPGHAPNPKEVASPPVAPPIPVETLSRKQFIQKYDAVYNKLEAFRKAYPTSTALKRFDATFRRVDRLNISDSAYSTLQSLSAQIDDARQKEPRSQ